MKNLIYSVLGSIFLFTTSPAWALFEARLAVGATQAKPDIADICGGSCGNPSGVAGATYVPGVGFDAIVSLPLIPFGFGARYEGVELKGDNANSSTEIKYSRTALLINYRLIDTIVHFGPIATYGLSHTGSLSITEGGNKVVDLNPSSMTSYTVGLELLVKPLVVIPLTVGAELGYMGYKWNDVTNNIDSSKKNVDLSGTYMKVFLGLDI